MKFIDTGVQYNPLEKPDPDLLWIYQKTDSGLGIYMLKTQWMKSITFLKTTKFF
jgi:hypothetical protein